LSKIKVKEKDPKGYLFGLKLKGNLKLQNRKSEESLSSDEEVRPLSANTLFIKKLYDHLHQPKNLKMWYKYPFQSINSLKKINQTARDRITAENGLVQTSRSSLSTQNGIFEASNFLANSMTAKLNSPFVLDPSKQLNFDQFSQQFRQFQSKHEGCGPMCPHLKKFYEKIGFDKARNEFKDMKIPKFIIDKIILGEMDEIG
jgi:hypothetical protein